jgi:DNA-binding NtrC family response regulator
VIQCADAASALAITDTINLLVADFVLPDGNGRELTTAIRERAPGVPAMLMSGYLPSPDLTPAAPSVFLQKPMTPALLAETVVRMLG